MVAYTARKNPLAMPTGAPAPAPAYDISADAYQPGVMSAAPKMQSPMAASTVSPFTPPQGPPSNPLLAAAFDGFQRGFDPAGFDKRQATNKAAEGDKLKQTLALMQQQRALPEQQRGQWWQQNAPVISKIIGQDVSQMPLDVTKFSDQALDGQIAALSAQAGIGPVVPEPMTAYQAALLKQREQETGQPTPFNLGDGAFAEYDPTAPAGSRLNLLREQTEQPVKMEQYTDATGQVWDRNPYTGESKKANVPRARVPGEGGGEGNKPPSGYYFTGNPEEPLAPIKGGPADPMRSGVEIDPKIIALETAQSGKWMPIQNNFQDIADQFGRINTLAKNKNSASDLGLIVSFTKMLDPGSVAREGEVALTQSAAGALDQAAVWIPRLQGGKTLLPDNTRQMYVNAARDMFSSYEKTYQRLADSTKKRATEYGLSPERIMLGYEPPPPAPPPKPSFANRKMQGVQAALAPKPQAAAAGVPEGVDPADWEFMTPEQKALFQ